MCKQANTHRLEGSRHQVGRKNVSVNRKKSKELNQKGFVEIISRGMWGLFGTQTILTFIPGGVLVRRTNETYLK